MCYPKPGPRCSAHARARLARAQHAVLLAFQKMRENDEDEVSEARWNEAMKARDEAQRDYELTPAGMMKLEHEIKLSTRPSQTASLEEPVFQLGEITDW